MASKFSNGFMLLGRSYAVAAKKPAGTASVMRKLEEFRAQVTAVKKEEFWMRDPNTGNWIPESQFNQIDAADLREQFLPKQHAS